MLWHCIIDVLHFNWLVPSLSATTFSTTQLIIFLTFPPFLHRVFFALFASFLNEIVVSHCFHWHVLRHNSTVSMQIVEGSQSNDSLQYVEVKNAFYSQKWMISFSRWVTFDVDVCYRKFYGIGNLEENCENQLNQKWICTFSKSIEKHWKYHLLSIEMIESCHLRDLNIKCWVNFIKTLMLWLVFLFFFNKTVSIQFTQQLIPKRGFVSNWNLRR